MDKDFQEVLSKNKLKIFKIAFSNYQPYYYFIFFDKFLDRHFADWTYLRKKMNSDISVFITKFHNDGMMDWTKINIFKMNIMLEPTTHHISI